MHRSSLTVRWTLAVAVVVCTTLTSAPLSARQTPAGAKKAVTHDVYDSWKSIQDVTLSRDGVWLVYVLQPQDGDGELIARNVQTGVERKVPRGKSPIITPDGRFVLFTAAPPKVEVDKAKKAKKKPEDQPKNGFGVLTLESGVAASVDRVKSFEAPEEASGWAAYLREPPAKRADAAAADEKKDEKAGEPADKKEKKKDPGTELVVRALADGNETVIPDVVEYQWSRDGAWLAYATSSAAADRDGVFVRAPRDASSRTLASGRGHYKSLIFDRGGRQLAFLTDRDAYEQNPQLFGLYLWTAGSDAAAVLARNGTRGLQPGTTVGEHGSLEFSKDGARLFFGAAPPPRPTPPDDADEPIKVDLWHWQDPELQPMQKVRAEDEKKRSYRAVVHLKDRRIVALGGSDLATIETIDHATVALGASDAPYRKLISWDGTYRDYYVVSLTDGARRKAIEAAHFGATLSPGGGYILYFNDDDNAWYTYRIADGRVSNLTKAVNARFEDETADTPEAPRPYGAAGWTDNDRSVLLNDRYDIWEIKPDGAAPRMITGGMGRAQKLTFRYQDFDSEQQTIPATAPLLLHVTDDTTKATGYYRVSLNNGGPPARLVMLDKLFRASAKAKQADVYVAAAQTFVEFPDLWTSDGSFSNLKKVSQANPQQAQYLWGKSELIDYVNADGKKLRAVLTKPENFDPSKKYPLMVYIYEELTNGLHRYAAPSPGTSVNITRYVSNGYIVLQPDIVYDVGYPGESALKCVVPAVHAVLAQGYIDPQRIGIQGHSWGGYQISYLITRTDIFRAVQAGASVVNMVSAYGGIRWGTGMSRAFQYEKTQSRIGGPPWDQPLQFIENSPIFWVEKVKTPYLTIHNDEDDAVPWYQAIEFFSALRRLGKEAYMFNYNGEKHGLRERENQKHWTVHMAEFFDHHLLGAPKPEWMEKGVPYLNRGTRDLSTIYRKTTNDRR